MKTSELNAAALDWAVAKIEYTNPVTLGGRTLVVCKGVAFDYHPSTDWAQGGPIIEREQIEVSPMGDGEWRAQIFLVQGHQYFRKYGPDPLTAAMRCYVQHKLGDTVEMPAALEE